MNNNDEPEEMPVSDPILDMLNNLPSAPVDGIPTDDGWYRIDFQRQADDYGDDWDVNL